MICSLAYTLAGVNLLVYAMVQLRPKLYKTKLYKPMLYNIKLSIIPIFVLIAFLTVIVLLQAANVHLDSKIALHWVSIIVAAIGLAVWVLLLPNAGYLITELNFNHREHDSAEVPLWYDIVGVLTLAMSGVMNMCFNVLIIQFMVALVFQDLILNTSFLFEAVSWLVMGLLMTLASFGIYLGRYLRFYSWDIRHPIQFLKKIGAHFATKESRRNGILFVVFHALFFIVFYRATVGVVLNEMISSFGLA